MKNYMLTVRFTMILFKKYLENLKKTHGDFAKFHDLRILDTEEYHFVLFDMVTTEAPGSEKVKVLKDDITRHILEKYPQFEVKINITPLHKTQGVF